MLCRIIVVAHILASSTFFQASSTLNTRKPSASSPCWTMLLDMELWNEPYVLPYDFPIAFFFGCTPKSEPAVIRAFTGLFNVMRCFYVSRWCWLLFDLLVLRRIGEFHEKFQKPLYKTHELTPTFKLCYWLCPWMNENIKTDGLESGQHINFPFESQGDCRWRLVAELYGRWRTVCLE